MSEQKAFVHLLTISTGTPNSSLKKFLNLNTKQNAPSIFSISKRVHISFTLCISASTLPFSSRAIVSPSWVIITKHFSQSPRKPLRQTYPEQTLTYSACQGLPLPCYCTLEVTTWVSHCNCNSWLIEQKQSLLLMVSLTRQVDQCPLVPLILTFEKLAVFMLSNWLSMNSFYKRTQVPSSCRYAQQLKMCFSIEKEEPFTTFPNSVMPFTIYNQMIFLVQKYQHS